MSTIKVLVTGSNGQLGQCLKEHSKPLEGEFQFVFATSNDLDITKPNEVLDYFKTNQFDYCINCAAYTAVDMAEQEKEKAYRVNVSGVENLVNACLKGDTTLIHVSTDFVFDGENNNQYQELDKTNPISVYGSTKLQGENKITFKLKKYFIIRTSWLYSEYGNNFVKTMLRLGKERDELSVVADQIGTPTYAADLANVIIEIIKNDKSAYGLYHYSNEGVVSWYEFAKKIFEFSEIKLNLLPIKTEAYPTPAKRPKFSVMDKSKIKAELNVKTKDWTESLKECLIKLQ